MIRNIVALILLCVSSIAWGHNVKIATFNFRLINNEWNLEMHFAHASLTDAMLQEFSEEEVQRMSVEEVKQWIVKYVRRNVLISAGKEDIAIGVGGIKLGSHQTDLRFVLADISVNPSYLSFNLPLCDHSFNHTNILRIYRGDEMTKFFLSEDNNFKVDLELNRDSIKELEAITLPDEKAGTHWGWSSLILLVPAAFWVRRRINLKFAA